MQSGEITPEHSLRGRPSINRLELPNNNLCKEQKDTILEIKKLANQILYLVSKL